MQLSCEGNNNIAERWLRTPHLLRWKTLSGNLCLSSQPIIPLATNFLFFLFFHSTWYPLFLNICCCSLFKSRNMYNDLRCIELWRRKHSSRLASLDIASGSNTREIGQRRRIRSPVIFSRGGEGMYRKRWWWRHQSRIQDVLYRYENLKEDENFKWDWIS